MNNKIEKLTSIPNGEKLYLIDKLKDKKAIVIESKKKFSPGIIIYKENNTIKVWVNNCPHANLTLDLIKGRVQNNKGELLCANHGAKFDPNSGLCIKGPCKEKTLTKFPFTIKKNYLIAGN